MTTTTTDLGRADWLYDDELGCHIPSCSMYTGNWRCGNGPLQGDQITTGNCGKQHIPTGRRFSSVKGSTPIIGGKTMEEAL
jgi:hypothetical protein